MDILTFTLYVVWALVIVGILLSAGASCLNGMAWDQALRRLHPEKMAERKAQHRCALCFLLACGVVMLFLVLVPR